MPDPEYRRMVKHPSLSPPVPAPCLPSRAAATACNCHLLFQGKCWWGRGEAATDPSRPPTAAQQPPIEGTVCWDTNAQVCGHHMRGAAKATVEAMHRYWITIEYDGSVDTTTMRCKVITTETSARDLQLAAYH